MLVKPTRREMPTLPSKPVPKGEQPDAPTQPRKSNALIVAYDFAADELLARLVEHSSTAREAMYDKVVSWASKPPTSSGRYGRWAFLLRPSFFGLRARESRGGAERAFKYCSRGGGRSTDPIFAMNF
eukprot:6201765-Pleurochrysis_carterae.AAC.3